MTWILWVIGYFLITLLFFGVNLFVSVKNDALLFDRLDLYGLIQEVTPLAMVSLLWPVALIFALLALPFAIIFTIVRRINDSDDCSIPRN